MKIFHIPEPELQFGNGNSICPKQGIRIHHPYDIDNVRPKEIKLGIIGKGDGVEKVIRWLEESAMKVDGKITKRPLTNLFPSFPGFNDESGFKSSIIYDDTYLREIRNTDFEAAIKIGDLEKRISEVVNIYVEEIKFLAKNKNANVILCVIPEKFVNALSDGEVKEDVNEVPNTTTNEEKEEDAKILLEKNFRRMLKAKAMKYHIPIQIVRDRIEKPTSDMQDSATIAWNLYTALYYKAGGTPWAMVKKASDITCFAGISFYRSRDKKTLQTSIAQIFNEYGKGVILRGEPVEIKSRNRTPHLSEEHAYRLLNKALKEYYSAIKISPRRLVIHKTSNFNEEEIEGFRAAAQENMVHEVDLITIQERTGLRMFREKMLPPLRGTCLSLDDKNHLLYTRGSIEHYQTYPGKYPPNPIEIRLFSHDKSVEHICQEVLALTKMNWNNTQFDRKYPITIECARKVGEILKYLEEGEEEERKYSFYM